MNLIINGNPASIDSSGGAPNISRILVIEKVETPDMVSVQVNGEFVDKDNWATTFLKPGDEVDFLYFMGGGQPFPVHGRLG